jgi:hypothetical protein
MAVFHQPGVWKFTYDCLIGSHILLAHVNGTQCLGNWICFCPQVKEGWEMSAVLDPLERANLSYCTTYVTIITLCYWEITEKCTMKSVIKHAQT